MTSTLMSMTKDPEEWNLQFQAIDVLRQINKYQQAIFLKYLDQYLSFLKDSVENLRSGISKNSLMLLNEFFNHSDKS